MARRATYDEGVVRRGPGSWPVSAHSRICLEYLRDRADRLDDFPINDPSFERCDRRASRVLAASPRAIPSSMKALASRFPMSSRRSMPKRWWANSRNVLRVSSYDLRVDPAKIRFLVNRFGSPALSRPHSLSARFVSPTARSRNHRSWAFHSRSWRSFFIAASICSPLDPRGSCWSISDLTTRRTLCFSRGFGVQRGTASGDSGKAALFRWGSAAKPGCVPRNGRPPAPLRARTTRPLGTTRDPAFLRSPGTRTSGRPGCIRVRPPCERPRCAPIRQGPGRGGIGRPDLGGGVGRGQREREGIGIRTGAARSDGRKNGPDPAAPRDALSPRAARVLA